MFEFSMEQFYRGETPKAYEFFGAHSVENDGGTWFRVYAPRAHNIEVIGDFNGWQGNNHRMNRNPYHSGVFEIFIAEAKIGQRYKYRVYQCNGRVVDKADPYAFLSELRPATASIIAELPRYLFTDEKWLNLRTKCFDKPMNIYEMHMGSWKIPGGYVGAVNDKLWYTYDEIADDLIAYLKENGFTHIEVLPLAEHPLDGSWGYQASGYFSATSRYGKPENLMHFVDKCHNSGIGVIIDFAFVHFVSDDYSLGTFDGSSQYEYPPSDVGKSEWGSYNFNLSTGEVQSFLMSAAEFWLDIYHFDGIRMDAISNAIYWMGNKNRGINDRSLNFVKKMNCTLNQLHPTVILIAEDSSDYAGVTKPVEEGGLGFDYKWDLGWMNDTLCYFKLDPYFRQNNHGKINWSMAYFKNERYLLPLSHDEVVHGKATIVQKMWGDNYENKFAQVRTLYTYMMTHPGKKLNFMGNELGMFREWNEMNELDWGLTKDFPMHNMFHKFFADLNKLVLNNSALYEMDYAPEGFQWIDADNNFQNVFTYYRRSKKQTLAIACNMSPIDLEQFWLGLDYPSKLKEIFNSDSAAYGGSDRTNPKMIKSENQPEKWHPYHAVIHLAPFSVCVFEVKEETSISKTEKTTPQKKATAKKVVKKAVAVTKSK